MRKVFSAVRNFINDYFRKVVIVGDDIHRKEDELGVLSVGLLDFLTDKNLLEQG